MIENVTFQQVIGSVEQVEILYRFLDQRGTGISHKSMPTFESHIEFVANHPYVNWYIILIDDSPSGSVYTQDDNSIGIDLTNPKTVIVKKILEFLTSNFSLKTQILSKVPPYFFINVSVDDSQMISILTELRIKPIQISYKIN